MPVNQRQAREGAEASAPVGLFRLLLLFELLDLTVLALDSPLLRVDLRLCPVLADLLVLQFVSDQETATCAERTADRGARSWRADRRANYRSGPRSCQRADAGALFARRERLA